MKIVDTTTVRHKIGTCPACRSGIWGDVDLDTVVSPPTMTEDGNAHAFARAAATGMRLAHDCTPEPEAGA